MFYSISKWVVFFVWFYLCGTLDWLITEKWKKSRPNSKILPNVCLVLLNILFLWESYRIIAEKMVFFYVNMP